VYPQIFRRERLRSEALPHQPSQRRAGAATARATTSTAAKVLRHHFDQLVYVLVNGE
jgi:hypothetical protein